MPPHPTSRPFGRLRDGRLATLWTLRAHGIEVDLTDYGATVVAVRAPDRDGRVDDVVLGFDDVAGYQSADNAWFGCTVGRVANRIARARFILDGTEVVLARNDGEHHLHGGVERSFDKVLWRAEPRPDAVAFAYESADGEEGYPGTVRVRATCVLLDDAGPTLSIRLQAATDRRTPVNLTHHSYWNLGGAGTPSVLDHTLWIDASHFTPIDDGLIPTGAIAPVAGTPFDFRREKTIGRDLAPLLATTARGYDHNLVLAPGPGLRHVATLHDPRSGRTLELQTTEPGLQLYSGNFLRGQRGKGGRSHPARSAVCLEPQHFPDSVHHPHFPTTFLDPGAGLCSEMRFRLTSR